MDDTHLYFNEAAAAGICEISVAQVRAYVRAGAPLSDPGRPPRRRYSEVDLRTFAICAAFQRDLGILPNEAVEYWRDLMPTGGWCAGNDHITFSVDGNPRVRVSPGSIASQVARRILAFDVRRHAAAEVVLSLGSPTLDAASGLRAPRAAKRRVTPHIVPANRFHPQRLTTRAPKPKEQTS